MILRADGTLDGKLVVYPNWGPRSNKPGKKRKLRWTKTYIQMMVTTRQLLHGTVNVSVYRLPATKRMKEHYVAFGLPHNGLLKSNERFGFGCTWVEAFRYLGNVVKVLEVERELMKGKTHATS